MILSGQKPPSRAPLQASRQAGGLDLSRRADGVCGSSRWESHWCTERRGEGMSYSLTLKRSGSGAARGLRQPGSVGAQESSRVALIGPPTQRDPLNLNPPVYDGELENSDCLGCYRPDRRPARGAGWLVGPERALACSPATRQPRPSRARRLAQAQAILSSIWPRPALRTGQGS